MAHSPEHEELRHYKVDRVEEALVSTFPFNRPAEFDLPADRLPCRHAWVLKLTA